MTRALDLSLPDPERRRAARLRGRWADLLYVPGPGFTSELEPAVYASSLVIVLEDGRAMRASSFVVPAFGGELCRLRLEPLVSYRAENLGSFFDPARRGVVYALTPDRRAGAARTPDRPHWSYAGASLCARLADVQRVRLLREHARGTAANGPFSWIADRGLALTSAAGEESLILARPGDSEHALLVSPPGLYRVLLESGTAVVPGATPTELLGYGDWAPAPDIAIELEDLRSSGA